MRLICPNNREHNEFMATAHVTQDWKVDENGMFLETIDECVDVIHSPGLDDEWLCAFCGATAITTGEIIKLFATVLEGMEDSYANIYSSKEEAESQIGKYIDGLKVVAVKEGYSLVPKGTDILYDDAPDFCESESKIREIARRIDVVL